MTDLKTRLSKAKTNLILEHPFFGALAMNMPFELVPADNKRIPTATTNGKTVWFNEGFIAPLSDLELTFLTAHEVCHPMFDHNARLGSRDHKKWNMATDYVVNQILNDEKIGQFIEGGCLNKALYDAGRGISEAIYELLPDQNGNDGGKFGQGGDGNGSAYDEIQDSSQSDAEREQLSEEWKVKVSQAAQSAKMQGKLSANIERLVGEVLNNKVDWRNVLRNFLTKAKDDTRSWARPNRRFLAQGLYLPSKDGEAMGELVVAVDCSGSIGDVELNQFAAEITAIKQDMNPATIHVVYFDSKVCHYDAFSRDDSLFIKAHGGGGTAFSPVFEFIDEKSIDPVATVFLTDLHCGDFGTPPAHPVLWVSYGADKAPWGDVVMM